MSLHGVYDEQNIFAKILRGEAPATRLYEDADTVAFLDIFPRSQGHTLVLPRYPARTLLELPADRLGPLMHTVQRLTHAIEKSLQPDGVMLVQFNGAPAGQTVFHLHMHIIPRFCGARLMAEGESPRADAAALTAIAAKITAAL